MSLKCGIVKADFQIFTWKPREITKWVQLEGTTVGHQVKTPNRAEQPQKYWLRSENIPGDKFSGSLTLKQEQVCSKGLRFGMKPCRFLVHKANAHFCEIPTSHTSLAPREAHAETVKPQNLPSLGWHPPVALQPLTDPKWCRAHLCKMLLLQLSNQAVEHCVTDRSHALMPFHKFSTQNTKILPQLIKS